MKCLLLINNNLKNFIRKKFALCFVILVSIITAAFGVLFYSGNLWSRYYFYQYDKGVTLTINADKSKNNIEIVNALNDIVSQKVQHINVMEQNPEFKKSKDNSENHNDYIVGEYSTNHSVMAGRYFYENENAPVLILMEDMIVDLGLKKVVGSKITLQNTEYTVVGMRGVSDYPNTYVVPLSYYLDNKKIGFISCTYKSYLSNNDIKQLTNYFNENTNILSYQLPKKSNPLRNELFRNQMCKIFFIFGVVLINVFVMLYYWIYKSANTYKIYKLCGADNFKNAKIIIGNAMSLILAGNIIGAVLFLLFYHWLYEDISSIITWRHYGISLLLEIGLTLIYSIIISIKMVTKKELYKIVGE